MKKNIFGFFLSILSLTQKHISLTKWVLLRFKFWNQFWVSLIALYKSLFFVFFFEKKIEKTKLKIFFFSKKNWKKLKCIKIFRWIFFFRKNIFYFKFLVFVRPTYKGTCIPNISYANHCSVRCYINFAKSRGQRTAPGLLDIGCLEAKSAPICMVLAPVL